MSRKQKDAAVAQSVVRRIGSAEVTGPIPVSSSARKERKPLIYKGFRFFYFFKFPVFFIGCLRFHSQTSDSHFLSFHISI